MKLKELPTVEYANHLGRPYLSEPGEKLNPTDIVSHWDLALSLIQNRQLALYWQSYRSPTKAFRLVGADRDTIYAHDRKGMLRDYDVCKVLRKVSPAMIDQRGGWDLKGSVVKVLLKAHRLRTTLVPYDYPYRHYAMQDHTQICYRVIGNYHGCVDPTKDLCYRKDVISRNLYVPGEQT